MRISNRGLTLIKRYEGFSATPYRCPAGIITIGYGHTQQAASYTTISEEEAESLLLSDVAFAEAAVARLIRVPLTQHQFDALVSFTFNLGGGALQRSSLRQTVNREQHAEVPRQLMRWVFAGGRKLSGLVARRRSEAMLYMEAMSHP